MDFAETQLLTVFKQSDATAVNPREEKAVDASVNAFGKEFKLALKNSMQPGKSGKRILATLLLTTGLKVSGVYFKLALRKTAKNGRTLPSTTFRGGWDLKATRDNLDDVHHPTKMNIRITDKSVTLMGWESVPAAQEAMMDVVAHFGRSADVITGGMSVRMHRTHFWIRPDQNTFINLPKLRLYLIRAHKVQPDNVKHKAVRNAHIMSASKYVATPDGKTGSVTVFEKGFVQLTTKCEDVSRALYKAVVQDIIAFLRISK